MYPNIRITNSSPRTATIDIEGVIGVAEELQFERPEERVATYEKFRDTLSRISELRTPRVVVNIRSAGGDVNDALLIHDSLCALGARITTRCYGYIASAATIIAQAASRGRREISANALYLVHNSVSRAEGNARALSQTLDLLCKTDLRIAEIYAARAGKPADEFLSLMNENGGNGRWLSPEEALAFGLVDRVVEAAPVSNDAAEQMRRLGLPEMPQLPEGFEPEKRGLLAAIREKLDEVIGFLASKKEAEPPLFEIPAVEDVAVRESAPAKEANPARLAAKATSTLPTEDPSVAPSRLSGNRLAYEEDARGFKA